MVRARIPERRRFTPPPFLDKHSGTNTSRYKGATGGTLLSNVAEFLQGVQLLTLIGVEQKVSAQETVQGLPLEVLQALQLSTDWVEAHLPDIATLTDTQL